MGDPFLNNQAITFLNLTNQIAFFSLPGPLEMFGMFFRLQ